MTQQPNPDQPNPQDPAGPVGPPPFRTDGPPYRRLVRSRTDAPISGVSGGIAAYLGVDPTLIRVLMVVAAVFTFPVGVIAYVILWAVIPQQ